jgi:transposase
VRATTVLNRVLDLPGITVAGVSLLAGRPLVAVVEVRPTNLSDQQATTLRQLKHRGGDLWRAYTLKEAFRAIFAGDLNTEQVEQLIDRWLSRASRSRIDAFVKAAKTIRKHRDGILAAIRLGNNGRAEGINNIARLIIHRARGFHSAEAALALVMLSCGPITLQLPHERPRIRSE